MTDGTDCGGSTGAVSVTEGPRLQGPEVPEGTRTCLGVWGRSNLEGCPLFLPLENEGADETKTWHLSQLPGDPQSVWPVAPRRGTLTPRSVLTGGRCGPGRAGGAAGPPTPPAGQSPPPGLPSTDRGGTARGALRHPSWIPGLGACSDRAGVPAPRAALGCGRPPGRPSPSPPTALAAPSVCPQACPPTVPPVQSWARRGGHCGGGRCLKGDPRNQEHRRLCLEPTP